MEEPVFLPASRLNGGTTATVLTLPEHVYHALMDIGPVRPHQRTPMRTIVRYRSIQAGPAVWLDEAQGELIQIPADLAPDADIDLVVSGDSLIGINIQDGDELLVELTDEVQEKDIAIAWVPGQGATAKILEYREDGPWLVPANTKYEPIPVTPETRFFGRVLVVIRRVAQRSRHGR